MQMFQLLHSLRALQTFLPERSPRGFKQHQNFSFGPVCCWIDFSVLFLMSVAHFCICLSTSSRLIFMERGRAERGIKSIRQLEKKVFIFLEVLVTSQKTCSSSPGQHEVLKGTIQNENRCRAFHALHPSSRSKTPKRCNYL